MLKVLHLVGIMNRAGLETFIMNVLRNIDRDNIRFDFLCMLEGKGQYDEEIRSLGSIIHHVKLSNKRGISRHIENHNILYKKFLELSKDYDVIHIHNYHAFDSLISCDAAIKSKMKLVILHSHSTNAEFHLTLHKIARIFLNKKRIVKLACSDLAGQWMYGKSKYLVIRNGIDICKFQFNQEKRDIIRKELGLNKEFAIGHVGRFETVKNQRFLIELAKRMVRTEISFHMFFVGDGEDKKEIEHLVKEYGVSDYITFLGIRDDVCDLLQAFDLFVLPSLFEGIPFSVIEAEASGLPCLLSTGVPEDVDFSNDIVHESIDDINMWVKRIQEMKHCKSDRLNGSGYVKSAGYDIFDNCSLLEKVYKYGDIV